MRLKTIILLHVSAIAALGQSAPTGELVFRLLNKEDERASFEAFVQLRQSLGAANASDAQALQETLCQQMASATSPGAIRRIGAVLSAAPSEEAVVAVLGKLDDLNPLIKQAACDAICQFGARGPIRGDGLVEAALQKLSALAQDENQPASLVDSALMGMTALGSRGADGLITFEKVARRSRNTPNVYYSALGRTGDPRVLPFLRDAVSDPTLHEGLRIQAVHAIGQVAGSLRSRGEPLDPREQAACVTLLGRILEQTQNDQLYGAALRSIGAVEDYQRNPSVYRAVAESLSSQRLVRIHAALDTIYAAPSGPPDAALVERIVNMTGSEDATCGAAAQAILERFDLTTGPNG